MRIIILLLALLISSCNPFISKDLRKKNRANKKLERLIKKYPDLKTKDTVIIEIPAIKIDTFIDLEIDTFTRDSIIFLIKDSIIREKVKDYIYRDIYPKDTTTHYIDGIKLNFWFKNSKLFYEIKKSKEIIPVELSKIEKIELTILEKILLFLGKIFNYIIYIVIVILIFFIIKFFISKFI